MSDDEDDFIPWTPDGAARVRAAAAELTAAITAHAEAVAAGTSEKDTEKVFTAGDQLLPALLAYADAQFEYTGTTFPLGPLYDLVDDEEDDEDEEEEEPPSTGVSILQRQDYRVTDAEAVMAAGRAAYLRSWPDDDEATAAEDVSHLGRALYQIGHADGWPKLGDVEGLRPVGASVVVVDREDTLGPDEGEWPEDLYAHDGEVLFEQRDLYGK
ncbi:hypothetical protein [Actinokineospora globicatena]|uniref:hypothetical protein n=1 Tax=Actinokineospora globicatena TaxID=103729 RepID=UPI0020A5067E|nr:hypothetical protein [Actinokineospora globicatena]MCP2305203.1 hypothetical protein [Actinokineospora globicatena]GLW80678.1 hypothetical protein Aglo01_51590 [Actinokineospora globicatena]GLW87505.1 hypothetical protein Aglo02_51440 [Actinokineospora globicatena]